MNKLNKLVQTFILIHTTIILLTFVENDVLSFVGNGVFAVPRDKLLLI